MAHTTFLHELSEWRMVNAILDESCVAFHVGFVYSSSQVRGILEPMSARQRATYPASIQRLRVIERPQKSPL